MRELSPRDWRGRNIAARKDSTGKRYTAMTGKRALLFSHVDVEPFSCYKVHLELKRENGNGRMCCNLFANRNFDFSQVGFTCDPSGWSLYDLTLKTGDFPPNLPVVLRLWRPKDGTGNVLVRRITMENASDTGGGDVRKVASAAGDTTNAAKARPGTRKLGGQKPVAPNPEEVKRVRVSQSIEEQRAKQRAQRRRRLGAPRPRRDRETRRSRRRKRKRISQFDNSPTRVMIIAGSGAKEKMREAAFTAAGFSVRSFRMGREQGVPLAARLKEFMPHWVHMVLDPLPARTPGPRTMSIVRESAPQAVVTAWWPKDSFDGDASAMFRRADLALVDGSSAAATYRGAGLPAWEWREGDAEEGIRKAARDLGCRLGFMDILRHEFSKERLPGTFKRLLCFVPKGSPDLFSRPEAELDGFSMKFLPFSSCEDMEAAAMDHRPDWIHLHCENPVRLPWKQAIHDLRRKLPKTLITAWHAGGNPPDPGFLALADGVDHMLVGDGGTLKAHVAEGMVHAVCWRPPASPDDSDGFASTMTMLAARMRAVRREFLLNHAGKRVDISVFIGTYNRLTKLRMAVQHALESAGDREVEVIVNDAGSTDGTVEWLKQKAAADPRVVLILSGKRTSFTQAFNESLRIAKGQYMCWLSDDIMSRGKTMAAMVELMRSLNPLDMGAFPIWNSWSRTVRYELRQYRNHLCPTVGCMHTETLRRLHGINIDYPFYGQDTDLDYRVLRIGGRIVECIDGMLDHVCELDELRKTNIQKHENMRGGDKFETACISMTRQRHHFPAILLVLADGADTARAEQAAACIRRQYANSHIYMASDPPAPAHGVLSMARAPVPSNLEYQRYDLVIELRPRSHALVSPKGKNGLPFVRSLIE